MKPSKTAVEKNIAAKRKRNPIIGKLLDLKYRINEAYTDGTMTGLKSDKLWVMGQISALREGARLDTHQMKKANNLWRTYETN